MAHGHSRECGAGAIEHLRLISLQRLEQRIHCELPFALRGKMDWRFTERDGKTSVSWGLRGRVSFKLRFVAQTVRASMELDCRYALDRLARLLEPPEAPHYSIAQLGLREVAPIRYVYRSYQGTLQALPASRLSLLAQLRQQLAEHGVAPSGAPLFLYLRTNTRMRTTACHVGIPVEVQQVGSLPLGELGAQHAYVVRLQGDRAALDIAWYLAMQRMLTEGIAPDQRLPPVETYLVDEDGGAGNACVTELHIPVRH